MKISRASIVILAAGFFCSAGPALAWDATGHQVVAAIAWSQMSKPAQDKVLLLFPDDLKAKGPVVFTRAPREGTPADPFPRQTYNHITISNWMDDIRSNSYDQPTAEWHYIDRAFFDGVAPKLAVPNSPNVREKICEQILLLKKLRNFDKVQPTDKDHADEKTRAAYAVAILTHLIGDIHQPLHCVSRYSPGFDEGDQGGNGFPLEFPKAAKLHYYWDGAGGLFDFVQLGREYDDNQQKQLAEFTGRVLARWKPEQHPEYKDLSVDDWVEESYKLACMQAYAGVKPKTAPDAAYSEKVQQLAAERIATAGYRLAAVLSAVFETP